MSKQADTILEFKNISKEFPGVKALNDVSFSIKRGTIHCIVGENGAGKSTLMKVIDGVYQADEGELFINGEKTLIKDPLHAKENGNPMI